MEVSETKQTGEVRARWSWTEPSVWTDRMLNALETGVKGGKWFSLIDKVYSRANLEASVMKVAANGGSPGVDHITVRKFLADWEEHAPKLRQGLREGSYRPQGIRRTYIPKPGSPEKRPLGIPTVRDRTVQGALRHVIEPIFERDFAETSYGFRPGRGCKDALREVDRLLKAGYLYVLDADLKSYFDTIPHDRLIDRIKERITDGRVIGLLESFLQQGILEEMRSWIPDEGIPQGAVISPLLANVYLNPLDHQMTREGHRMIRYADDFVVLCRTAEEATAVWEKLRHWTHQEGLSLHPEKTRIVDLHKPGAGFDFLGYHFVRTARRGKLTRWPRKKSLQKLKDTVRDLTRRTNGRSLEETIRRLNYHLRGWYHYFQHSYSNTFTRLDQWIRMRLRSILRKRQKRRGRGRGRDHQRWPNAYFTERGLFSLAAAHASARSVPSRVNH